MTTTFTKGTPQSKFGIYARTHACTPTQTQGIHELKIDDAKQLTAYKLSKKQPNQKNKINK